MSQSQLDGAVVPPPLRVHRAKHDRCYLPSYDWGAPTLGDQHERIADALWRIPGWLAPEDAMKLYELAWFTPGPILEIGTFCGRSAVAMAFALLHAGRPGLVVSVDVDSSAIVLARRFARAYGVEQRILLVCGNAEGLLSVMPSFQPGLVFIDGDHSTDGVRADLEALASCVGPGTLLLLHDYLPDGDVPNTSGFPVSPHPIEVAETVADSWLADHADFAGTFGCSALYRVRSTPAVEPSLARTI